MPSALNNAYDYGYYYEDCVVQLNPADTGIDARLSNGGNGWASMGQITGNATGIYFRTGGAIVELSYSLTPTVSTLVSSSILADTERRLHRRGQLPLCRDRLRHRHPPLRRHDGGNDPRSGDPGDDRVRGRLLLLGLVLLARRSCL